MGAITTIRYGLVVRIPGSHPGGPGSIPGNGIFFPIFSVFPHPFHFNSCLNVLNGLFSSTALSKKGKRFTTKMGFEPTRAEPIGLAVQRLNHSATSSCWPLPSFLDKPSRIKEAEKSFPYRESNPGLLGESQIS